MKQQLTSQVEKFNKKAQKSAALKAELDYIKQREDQAKKELLDQYEGAGMAGALEWKKAGFDPHHDSIAMLISWNGIEKLFKVNDEQKETIAKEIVAPLAQEIIAPFAQEVNALKTEMSEMKSMLAQLMQQNAIQAAMLEKLIPTGPVMGDVARVAHAGEVTRVVHTGDVTVVKEKVVPARGMTEQIIEESKSMHQHPILDNFSRRGRKPIRVVQAMEIINSSMTDSGRIKWSLDVVFAVLTVLEYKGIDIEKSTRIVEELLGRQAYQFFAKNRAALGINSYQELIENYKNIKEAK